MNKREIRKATLTKRKEIKLELKELKSKSIIDKILSSDWYKKSEILLVYAALKDEVNLDEFIEKAWADGKELYFPRVTKTDMDFYKVSSFQQLGVATFNVREPKRECKLLDIYNEDFQKATTTQAVVVIVPGVAFAIDGTRVGYGKGYYDKYLHKIPKALRVGIAFEEQIVDKTYADAYDEIMHIVLTDKREVLV